ncbi:hypothetical protein ACE3MQ_02685 [Paenibacillus lentus]|uniref:hypothetical protein n=1 Tax=Paenibacillus lentus TaxID=1338368 RepID=UPI00365B2290
MSRLKRILAQARVLSPFEKSSITKMISYLPNNYILESQMKNAVVVSVCDCGCKTIDLRIPPYVDKYVCNQTVPVEMEVELGSDSAPILFLLHVVNGYIDELEIFKLDSSPIDEEIDISNGIVHVRL